MEGPVPSFDSVTFNTAGFELAGDEDGVRVWHTSDADPVGLYYFPIPPDIEADLDSIEELQDSFAARAAATGQSAAIEVDPVVVDDCPSIRTIVRVRQQPSGVAYVGSFTLPFRDFSFVGKAQCLEHGVTGIRETVLAAERLRGEGGSIHEIFEPGRRYTRMVDQ